MEVDEASASQQLRKTPMTPGDLERSPHPRPCLPYPPMTRSVVFPHPRRRLLEWMSLRYPSEVGMSTPPSEEVEMLGGVHEGAVSHDGKGVGGQTVIRDCLDHCPAGTQTIRCPCRELIAGEEVGHHLRWNPYQNLWNQ